MSWPLNIGYPLKRKFFFQPFLVGGSNPFEKYWSKWESSPNRSENKKHLKPPTRFIFRGKLAVSFFFGGGRETINKI